MSSSNLPPPSAFDRRQWFGLLIGALAAGLIIFGTVTLFAVRATQVANTEKTDQNAEGLALVKDCVEPDGKCFKDGQKRTAKVVGDISRANATAAAAASTCAVQMPDADFASIYRCTVRNVERAHKLEKKP